MVSKKEYLEIIKKSNEYYDKKYDLSMKLKNDGLLTYNENNEIILNWDDANPHQDWMMRRFKEYTVYYNNYQNILNDLVTN